MRVQTYERRLGINPANIPAATPNIDNGDYGANSAGNIQELAARMQKLQNDTEDARTLELFNQFKQETMNYHDNPDTGILNTRLGYMASGIYQDADTWMRSKGEEYVQKIKSNRAKRNFRKMAGQFIVQQSDSNSRFEAQQIKHYQTEQADASIKNSLNYIEAHFNEPEIIERERFSIRQALELKMRGSSIQAFNEEYAKIEDQIGVARIRQAYAVHPLNALTMMQDADIHLLPETRAKLQESLKGKTEVYRLNAIAQAYAQYYTPENAEAAHQALIQRYGSDEGNKAFTALNHLWQIGNMQKNARQNQLNEIQKNNADNFIKRFNDPNAVQPTRDEVLDAQRQNHINPTFAQSMLHAIDAREQNDQKKLKEYNERLIRIAVDSGVEFSREQAVQLFSQNIIGDATKNYIFESIEKRDKSEKQNLLEAQKSYKANLLMRLSKNNPNDLITIEDLDKAANDHLVRPEDYPVIKRVIEARDKLTALEEKQKRGREIIANAEKGVFDSPEKLERQYIAGEIPDNAYFRVTAERRRQDTQTAKSEQKKHEAELDVLAHDLSVRFPAGQSQGFFDYLTNNNISPQDREYLISKYNKHIQLQKQLIEDRKNAEKELHDAEFRLYYSNAKEGIHLPKIERVIKYHDGVFTQQQFDDLNREEEKQMREQLKANEELKKQTVEQTENELWFAAMNGHHKSLDELNDLVKDKAIRPEKARMLYSIKQAYDKAKEKAELEFWKDRMHDTAKELAEKFPLGSEQSAYEELNQYSRTEREAIKRYYDDFIQEQRTAKQNQDKEKALRQENKFNSFHNYWDKAQPVPIDILRNALDAEEIKREHYDRALAMNAALSDRKGVEDNLIKNMDGFTALSRTEQERLIMQHMGVNEDLHKAEFTSLYRKVIEGTATDAMIDWAFVHGRITTDDKEELKKYDSKFDKQQKDLIRQAADQIRIKYKFLDIKKNSGLYEMFTLNHFYENTRLLDVHSKNFYEALSSYYKQAFLALGVELEKNGIDLYTNSGWFGFGSKVPTLRGQRYESILNSPLNIQQPNPQITYRDLYGNEQTMQLSGDVVPFDNSVEITPPPPPPEPEPPQPYGYSNIVNEPHYQRMINPDNYSSQNNRSGQSVNVGSEMVSGGTKTGSFNDWRAYRNGKHNGIDIAAKEGTPIMSPDIGSPLTVSKVRTSKPSRGGGNSVILTTTDVEGNTYEFIVSHMQNGSIPLKVGDLVQPGTLIGRVGNTGMTSDRKKGGITAWYEGKSSGYHMDLKIKKNGKYIDPEKFVIPKFANNPAQQNNNVQPQPQPIIEPFTPLVSSDAEFERAAFDILGLNVNPLWGDISGDIASPNPYGFGGF